MLHELQELGLNPKEAKVYVACFEVGSGSAQRIAERAKLPKSTTFDILKSLNSKGLVSITKKKSSNIFLASDLGIFQEKMKRQKDAFEKIYPELYALYNSGKHKPKIRFFDGKAGMSVLTQEVLKEAKDIDGFGCSDEAFRKLSEYFPDFPKRRAEKKIPIRLILKDTPHSRERERSGKYQLRYAKVVPIDVDFASMMWIWNNKLALIGFGEDIMIIIIENRDFANMMRGFFEVFWRSLDSSTISYRS